MPIPEPVKKQFIDFITLQVFDDQYIDRQEEKKIVEEGIKKGLSVEESLSIMQQISSEKGWVLERDAEERTKDMLEVFATNDGKVDKKEFEDALGAFKKHSKGKIPEPELKRRLKKMMEDNGWKAKEGGLFGKKWYSAIE
jgi:Ca2+-binding EF-hand superfamily protein